MLVRGKNKSIKKYFVFASNPVPLLLLSLLKHLVVAASDILKLPHVILIDDFPLQLALLYHLLPVLSEGGLHYRRLERAQILKRARYVHG